MENQAGKISIAAILFGFLLFSWFAPAVFADSTQSVNLQSGQSGIAHFLALADIHFDPFLSCRNRIPCPLIEKLRRVPSNQWSALLSRYDTTPPQYRFDTSYPLLTSALDASRKAARDAHARFVLVLGDFIGHEFRYYYRRYSTDMTMAGYQSFVRKTMEFLTGELASRFPDMDIYSLVGNNDSYQDDYVSNPGGQFFRDTAVLWSRLVKNKDNRMALQKMFVPAGYYSVTLPERSDVRLIILNTNLFSYKAQGRLIDKAAVNELNWLHDQLRSAKENNQKVLIAMHIPEGIDVYATLRTRLFRLIALWKSQYAARFQSELQQYASEIAGILVGHLHSDWFQILTFDNSDEIPITGVPSISPIFGNNPGFKIYTYGQQPLRLKDFTTYYYPVNGKKSWGLEYNFSRVYQGNCQDCSITSHMRMLKRAGTLADFYKDHYSLGTQTQPITSKWYPYYWCAIWEVEQSDYRKCINQP